MEQQIILEMYDGKYPFGHMSHVSSKVTMYVRKTVKYTKQNYNALKQKYNLVKSLNNPNIIRLVKVLEEVSQFHLLYQYIPKKLEQIQQKKKYIENYRIKLIYLSSFLVFHNIKTNFALDSIGVDEKGQIKFYLNFDFQYIQNNQQIIKNRYMTQIKQICKTLQTKYSSNNQYKSNVNYQYFKTVAQKNLDTNNCKLKKGDWNSKSNQNRKFNSFIHENTINNSRIQKANHDKSLQSQKPKVLEILNNIEQKIDNLRSNNKNKIKHDKKPQKGNQKQSEEQSKDYFDKDSIRILSKKQKIDQRKYSSDPHYIAQFLKKTQYSQQEGPKSVRIQKPIKNKRSLQKINQAEEQDKLRQYQMMKNKANTNNKHPKTKKDFEELKILQFNNFAKCKEQYINQFFGILDDQTTFTNNYSNVTTKEPASSTNLESTSFENLQKLQPQLKRTTRPSIMQNRKKPVQKLRSKQSLRNSPKPINLTNDINKTNLIVSNSKKLIESQTKNLNISLKQRISQALLKTDEALLKYHQFHPQSTKNLNLSFQSKK